MKVEEPPGGNIPSSSCRNKIEVKSLLFLATVIPRPTIGFISKTDAWNQPSWGYSLLEEAMLVWSANIRNAPSSCSLHSSNSQMTLLEYTRGNQARP